MFRDKNLRHNFQKIRGGSKAVWNFSENLSDLVAGPSLKLDYGFENV